MNIIKMMPFLDHDGKEEIVNDIISGKFDQKNIDFKSLMPFLDDEQLHRIVKASLNGEILLSLNVTLPFLGESTLDMIIDHYENNKLPEFDIEKLYPFLSSKQMHRLFKQAYRKQESIE